MHVLQRFAVASGILALGASASAQIIAASAGPSGTTASFTDDTSQKTAGGTIYSGDAAVGGNAYNTSKIEVTWSGDDVSINLITGFKANSSYFLADLLFDFDQNGSFEKALAMSSHQTSSWNVSTTKGALYDVSSYHASSAFGYSTYGKQWKDADYADYSTSWQTSNVWIKSGTKVAGVTGTVGLTDTGWPTDSDRYIYTVTLTDVNATGTWDNFNLFWGTATCSNDAVYVEVVRDDWAPPPELPEPSTYGLIGAAGLVGLIAFRRRQIRRSKNSTSA